MLLTTTASTHRSTHTIRTHKHTHRHARVHTPIHRERESLGELSADTHRRAERARLHGTDHRVEASATAETRSPRSPHRSMPRYLEATLWSASQMTYTHDMKIVHTSHPSILPPRLQSGTSGGGFRGGRRNTHLPRRLHLASWSRSSHALTCPPNVRRCTRTHTHTRAHTRTHHDSRCCCPCYLRRRIRGAHTLAASSSPVHCAWSHRGCLLPPRAPLRVRVLPGNAAHACSGWAQAPAMPYVAWLASTHRHTPPGRRLGCARPESWYSALPCFMPCQGARGASVHVPPPPSAPVRACAGLLIGGTAV